MERVCLAYERLPDRGERVRRGQPRHRVFGRELRGAHHDDLGRPGKRPCGAAVDCARRRSALRCRHDRGWVLDERRHACGDLRTWLRPGHGARLWGRGLQRREVLPRQERPGGRYRDGLLRHQLRYRSHCGECPYRGVRCGSSVQNPRRDYARDHRGLLSRHRPLPRRLCSARMVSGRERRCDRRGSREGLARHARRTSLCSM